MKRILFSSISIIALALTGCATKKETLTVSPKAKEYVNEFENAPDWVIKENKTNVIYGLGSAKIGPAGLEFAKQEAVSIARDDISRQFSVRVKTMIKNFTEQTGAGDNRVVDKVVSSVSKQLSSTDISGTQVSETWISPTSNVYVRVKLTKEGEVKNNLLKEFEKVSTDSSLWNNEDNNGTDVNRTIK